MEHQGETLATIEPGGSQVLKGECDRFSRSESGRVSAGVQLVQFQGELNPLKKMKVSYMICHQHFNWFLL